MELRPYQQAARLAIEDQWSKGVKNTILVLPTGTGKTIVFSKVIEDRVKQDGSKALILAHRGELLDQAEDKLEIMTGMKCAIEKADQSSLGTWNAVTVGSVQSLMREDRLNKFDPDYFKTIVIDEAHHALTDSYRRIIDHFSGAKLLGVTATPDRGDKKKLGEVFESLAYEYSIVQAIKDGYLCKIKAQTVPLKIDMNSVSIRGGDYSPEEIDSALDPYLEQIAEEMKKYCSNRKTVVFLPLIKTSKKFQSILLGHGFKCAEVNGESKDRTEILKDFADNKYNVICNSMLLTEGWDCPDVDCIVMLRPTKIRSLYCQAIGRGTRICDGKDDLLILDFLWLSERHELCRPADIICTDRGVAKRMTDKLAESGMAEDIQEAESEAQSDVVRDREEALAKELKAMRQRKAKLVDPLQWAVSINAEDLVNYEPSFGWEMTPASTKQIEALEHAGIFAGEITNAGMANKLLERINDRRMMGLATPKQVRFLEGRNFQRVGTWSFEDANSMITRISLSGWQIPIGVDPVNFVPKGGLNTWTV